MNLNELKAMIETIDLESYGDCQVEALIGSNTTNVDIITFDGGSKIFVCNMDDYNINFAGN